MCNEYVVPEISIVFFNKRDVVTASASVSTTEDFHIVDDGAEI